MNSAGKKSLNAPAKAAVVVLLGLLWAQTLWNARSNSPTHDEFSHHIASGYSHLVTGDFRMNPAMPPLPRLLSAIPLYFLGAKAPLEHVSWREGDSPEFARQFFYGKAGVMDAYVFWARVPIMVVSTLFGLVVFCWAFELMGAAAGLTALTLYVFCPDVVAHSSLATSDICVSFFFFLALWRFWKYLKKPSLKNRTLTGVVAGLAFLSKFSALLLFPVLLIAAFVAGERSKVAPRKIAFFLAICALTVWAGYFFEIKPLLLNTPDPPKKIEFLFKIGGEGLVHFAKNAPVPLATFFSALGSFFFTRAKGTHAFLLGQWSNTGWWYYYFVAFAVKNTIPFLLLALGALFSLKWLPLNRTAKVILVVPVVFFFVVTMPDRAQAGIRYFLPIYPCLFVLGACAAVWAVQKKRALTAVVVALLAWHAAEAARIAPDDLAYFNQLAGGPSNGYKFLRDSNIDWGQNLKKLGEWSQEQGYPEVVVIYFGPADPSYYKIPYRLFTPEEMTHPQKTVYAIGAHGIDTVEWALKTRPTKIIGHSMFVYDLRASD